MLAGLQIQHHFASVEHPQSNGQAESANKVVLNGLKKRCDAEKSNWVENLFQVLWNYRTTPHSSTGETPFRLVYGTDAVIPVEIGNASMRTTFLTPNNDQLMREDKDLAEEVREVARLSDIAKKQQVNQRYNIRVQERKLGVGDLVVRRASIGNKNAKDGKLAANWEGPYRLKRSLGQGAYALEHISGDEVPRTFNIADLKRWFC
jgi:hypothetical protein